MWNIGVNETFEDEFRAGKAEVNHYMDKSFTAITIGKTMGKGR